MAHIRASHLLFLNRQAGYIRGPRDQLGGPLSYGTSQPNSIHLAADIRLRLTVSRLNPEAIGEIPSIGDLEWTIPGGSRPWTNRDVLILGYLLAHCPLRFEDGEEPAPLPSDYIRALYEEPGERRDESESGWVAAAAASELLLKLALRFPYEHHEEQGLGGGFHALALARSYHALSPANLGGGPTDPGRDRVLTAFDWPTIDRASGRLRERADPEGHALSWRQVGLVMAQDNHVAGDLNPLVRSGDLTATLSADFEVPVFAVYPGHDVESARTPVYLPAWYSLRDAEQHLVNRRYVIAAMRPVQLGYVYRPVTRDFVEAFRTYSEDADRAYRDPAMSRARYSGEFQTPLCVVPSNPARIPCLQLVSGEASEQAVKRSLLIQPYDVIEFTSGL